MEMRHGLWCNISKGWSHIIQIFTWYGFPVSLPVGEKGETVSLSPWPWCFTGVTVKECGLSRWNQVQFLVMTLKIVEELNYNENSLSVWDHKIHQDEIRLHKWYPPNSIAFPIATTDFLEIPKWPDWIGTCSKFQRLFLEKTNGQANSCFIPIESVGLVIFTYMNGWFWWLTMVNVGKYTIHGFLCVFFNTQVPFRGVAAVAWSKELRFASTVAVTKMHMFSTKKTK